MTNNYHKWALKNALDHHGKAELKAVIPKILGENPELRNNLKKIIPIIQKTINQVNKMSVEQQLKELKKLAPELLEKKQEEKGLPELPNVKGRIIMRLAPNPNGPVHLGHARMLVLNDEYVKKYGGTLILKYDDTDPKNENKKPTKLGYESIKKDLSWLGIKTGKTVYASKNIPRYYEVFEKILKQGNAYICTCDWEKWKKMKAKGTPCPCRKNSPEKNLERWKKMLNGGYAEGKAVARVKTDIKHKDPAERDWAAFRIIKKPNHALVDNKYTVWPLMDIGNAVDDHDNKVTHILRGQDLAISGRRQEWLYKYMEWTYPETITFGHLGIQGGGTFSKSRMKKGIKEKTYTGWDDPRLGTLMSLRRRGFQPEAIREFITTAGMRGKDATVSFDKIKAINKKHIDPTSNRYFFVEKPKTIMVDEIPKQKTKVPLSPYHKKTREYTFNKKKQEFYISGNDYEKLKVKNIVRLKDLFNIHITGRDRGVVSANQSLNAAKQKIQWVKKDESIPISILMPDSKIIKGYGEKYLQKVKIGEIVQFERFGFVKKEKPHEYIFTQS